MTAEVLTLHRYGKPMATYSRKRRLQYRDTENEPDKPLKGKAVYLDLCGFRRISAFKDDIVSLGARVETFLSKDINFLITNQARRTDVDNAKRGGSDEQSPSPSVLSTPSPFNNTNNNSPSPCDPQSTNTVSRGRLILQKARVKSQASVIENALNWGVKVVYLDTAQKWIAREKTKRNAVAKSPGSPCKPKDGKRKAQCIPLTVRPLCSPYLKCEMTTRQYRPMYSEFDQWPSINVDTPRGSCPFDGRYGLHDPDKDRGLHFTLPITESVTANMRTHSTPAVQRANDSFDLGHIITLGDAQRATLLRRRVARKKGFCECCRVLYDDIDMHIQTTEHAAFVDDDEHFERLAALISTCSDVQHFLKSIPTADSDSCASGGSRTHRSPDQPRLPRRSPRKHLSSTPHATFVKLSPSLRLCSRDVGAVTGTRNITLDVRTPSKTRASSPRKNLRRSSTPLTRSFSANFIQTLGPIVRRFQPASDGIDSTVVDHIQ